MADNDLMIFVSYDHRDEKAVVGTLDQIKEQVQTRNELLRGEGRKVAPDLHEFNLNFWRDKVNIGAGMDWQKSIDKAIEQCDIFMVFALGNRSEQVRAECGKAISAGKLIVPIAVNAQALQWYGLNQIHALVGDKVRDLDSLMIGLSYPFETALYNKRNRR